MPKAKKSIKLRDQNPTKDPRGGGGAGRQGAGANTVNTEGGTSKNQRGHHRGHGRF